MMELGRFIDKKLMFTLPEVAIMMGLDSDASIRHYIRSDKLNSKKIAGKVKVSFNDLVEFEKTISHSKSYILKINLKAAQ